jgi:hypothetical protein
MQIFFVHKLIGEFVDIDLYLESLSLIYFSYNYGELVN